MRQMRMGNTGMKVAVFTICLNAMPTLPSIFFTLNSADIDWHWYVAEGASMNTHCTSWCNQQEPGLSKDGTTEFLNLIAKHPRVTVIRKEMWDGKVEMCNECLSYISEECILIQMDADELWRADVLERFVHYFAEDGKASCAQLKCRYFLGVDILSAKDGTYGNKPGEWLRAWKFTPGDKFERHEPPQLKQAVKGYPLSPQWLSMDGIYFDHYAWAFENQVAYKELFYGYSNAMLHWLRLQDNTSWPVNDLRSFLPWVGAGAQADKLK